MTKTSARFLQWAILLALSAAVALALVWWFWPALFLPGTRELSISGGDPYLRALMRTISASEANVHQPYHVLHGGSVVTSLDEHPNQCLPIKAGPNKGRCSTAAGRYQLLHATWLELAQRYHPTASKTSAKEAGLQAPFGPTDQDVVVLRWLADDKAWGMDLADRLRRGEVEAVFRRLSRTWTSLGYGAESNQMTTVLPRVYDQMLRQELSRSP